MKKLFIFILLILLVPLSVSGLIIVGTQTNNSVPLPIVATTAATSITSTSATLNGTVYNYNSAGTYYFNYGLTSSYGSQTTSTILGASVSIQSLSAAISNLANTTTYHFQLCAINSVGLMCGSDLTFVSLTPSLTRVASITYGTGLALAQAIAIDITGGYLYTLSQNGQNGHIEQIRLSDFTAQLNTNITTGTCAGVGPSAFMDIKVRTIYSYISCAGGGIVQYNLPALTYLGTSPVFGGIGSNTYNTAGTIGYISYDDGTLGWFDTDFSTYGFIYPSLMADGGKTPLLDESGNIVYFMDGTTRFIRKYTAGFHPSGALAPIASLFITEIGDWRVGDYDGDIDISGQFAYYGGRTGISKVNLTTFTETAHTVFTQTGITRTGVVLVDPTNGVVFQTLEKNNIWTCFSNYGSVLIWYKTSTLSQIASSITLNIDENSIRGGVIDTVNKNIYLLVLSCNSTSVLRGEVIKISYVP